ncbi:two-component sensor histidine kinase [Qipengyuania sp. GH38]|uniref:sensor histidine kinase n=1 Tax=Qipengyuania intermedia TaxID=2867244 RepID=UPI001C888603|nr:ATP-binding protein [Qipengyuania intermedia]MBX7512924.1 two-component sensor histidine kinase [Qipengyuania intermedia]
MSARSFPWSAFALAIATTIGLLVLEVPFLIVAVVLLVWAGSLWLVGSSPPPPAEKTSDGAISRDSMGDLFEHSETPVLLTESGRVIIANIAARRLLGAHILGQDVKMALRQPEAVRLLETPEDGAAVVRGLARRKDIWRINRKKLDKNLSVIELVNKTAEADISRAHTDFVANASHELRTPLAAILGYVETLREDGSDIEPKMADKFLATIQREAKRLQDLVSDLMSLSRIEAEKHDLPAKTVALGELAKRAAQDGAGPERLDRLDFEAHGEFLVRGDEQQLEQLVRNLVDNAMKYGAPETPVTVRLVPQGDARVLLTVTDRGDGIAPEHIPHLTRRFYRTDPGRSRASGGTGLGLAIVKHIVERHRGKLVIESKQGEGTRVKITLPLAD